ncbi:hypothetical protein SALBM135S_02485 [Streptomyces alboniger]
MSIWTEISPTPFRVEYVDAAGIPTRTLRAGPGRQVVLPARPAACCDGTGRNGSACARKAVNPLTAPLDPSVAASFFVPATTAYVALHDVGRIEKGEDVVVVGAAGAVGAMVAQQALAAGARVTGVVGREDQLADVPKGVEALTLEGAEGLVRDRAASLLVDTLGGAGLAGRSKWVRQGGRAVVIGYVAGPRVELDLPSWLLDEVALLPVNMIRQERRAREVSGDLARRLSEGELTLAVQEFGLTEVAAALDALRGGRVRGRAVLLPG